MMSRGAGDAGAKLGSTARGGAAGGTGRARDAADASSSRGNRERGGHSSSHSSRHGGEGKGGGDADAMDTLDKLLTELCHAGQPRGARARAGRARGGLPANPWDRAGWSTAVRKAVAGRGGAGDADDVESASSDEEAPGAANHHLLHHHRHHSAHDLDAAFSASFAGQYNAGLYKSSGMGVGGIHGVSSGFRAASQLRTGAGGVHTAGIGGTHTAGIGGGHAMGIDGFDGSSRRAGGAVGLSLREHVEAEARNKPQELFARYMRDLYRRILRLINSPDLRYRLGGVYAIDQLTDAKLGENVGKINRFATYLRDVITPTCEPALAEAASRALGHLVSVGGALTADIVDMEVKRSIAWLRDPERVEARRYAAVLILRELARNAPTVFNVHVPAFIDAIWPALRDQSLAIREAAVRALRECLVVIEKRETRYRVQWYYRLYEETQGGLLGAGKPGGGGDRGGGSGFGAPSVERTHGSLLAFGEMLRHTGEFMLSRYKEVAETVLRLHESKERIVRRSVVELVPRLAAFSPARFAESYLSASAALLLATIRSPDMRDAGFMAVGDLAAALASDDASDAKASEISGSIDEGGSTHGGSVHIADDVNEGARVLGSRDGSVSGNLSGNLSPGGVGYLARQAAGISSSGSTGNNLHSLPRARSSGGMSDPGKPPNVRGRAARAFERYLPEIASVIQETCVQHAQKNSRGRKGSNAGGAEGAVRVDAGHAEALLCAGALARSMDVAWEPHVRTLLPAMFAGGLSAPLVDALEGVSNALPALTPAIQRKLIEVISSVLSPETVSTPNSALTGRLTAAGINNGPYGNNGTGDATGASGANDRGGSVGSKLKKAFSGVFGASLGGSQHGGSQSGGTLGAGGNASTSATHSRQGSVVFQGLGFGSEPGTGGSPAGSGYATPASAPGTPKRGGSRVGNNGPYGNNGAPGETQPVAGSASPGGGFNAGASAGGFNGAPPGSPAGVPGLTGQSQSPAQTQPGPALASPMKQIFGVSVGGSKDKAVDATRRKAHRARVQLALRTLGTFPFGASVLLGFVRRNVVEYLDDDDPATRREAALTCCRLLEVRSDRLAQKQAGNGNDGFGGVATQHYHAPHGSDASFGTSHSGAAAHGWSAGTEEFIMSRLLAVAVSDLDAGVRKAVLASFCRPCPSTDSHLGQADALRALFVTLNDENPEVRLIAIRLVGRLAPRNPAYALPALRRHLLQLLAELEHSTESHMREEGARNMAALVRSCERLVTPYISPILRVLMNKLRRPEDGKGSASTRGTANPGDGSSAGVSGPRNGETVHQSGKIVELARVDGDGQSDASNQPTTSNAAGKSEHQEANRTGQSTALALGANQSAIDASANPQSRAPAHIVGVREKAAVLGTIGELAQVGGEGVASFIPQLLVLIIDGVRVGSTRDVAIVTMGQLIESTGFVIRPFNEHPGLLSLMLRVLAEETGPVRAELLRTLGVLGALDPHAHRENEERIHGQGLLSMEGVRGVGRAGETKKPEELQSKAIDKTGASVGGGFPGLDGDDPLPSTNLTTASDNFYPTVALNALLRVLRDPSMASHHHMVVRSIMYIFKALGLNCVQYLPAVMPVVINVMNTCEDGLREFMLAQLTALVAIIRGHVRRYLDDILHIIHSFWGPNQLLRQMLRLCEELATALHDEFRRYLPDLLPRMIAVLAAAERSGNFSAVPSVLHALEAFGSAVDEHLHLMLPALVRLFRPGVAPVPTAIRAQVLRSLTVLLPRMQLADHASAVVHPLVRVLDGPVKELRRDALVALTSLANSLGQDFLLFLPLVRRTVKKRSMRDPVFERIVERLEAERVAGGAKNSVNTAGGGTNRLGLTPNATTSGGGDRSTAFASQTGDSPSVEDPGESTRGGRRRHSRDSNRDVDIRGNSLHGGYSLRHLSLADPAAGLVVDESALRRAWESSQRSTKEDWLEWMRHLSVELLKQSPSPALRACIDLAMVQPHLARDLFCASFVSCWSELSAVHRDQLVRSLEAAFGSPTIPPEIVTTLLNLAEFCEHDEKPLPVDIRTLGMIAERCRAYAKALHYKETEFVSNPAGCVEAIIAINNQLQLPEAAMGVLVYAQAHLRLDIKEGWYEKLGRWDEALEAHARKADAAEATLRDAGVDRAGNPLLSLGDDTLRRLSQGSDETLRRLSQGSAGAPPGAPGLNPRDPNSGPTPPSRGPSFGDKRGGLYPGGLNELTLASMVMNRATAQAALEARREATLGQMRCLAALAEWEQLATLCAREWELSAGVGAPGAGGVGAGGDAVLRGRMAPLATQAAWHLGDWARMETYSEALADARAASLPSGPSSGGKGGGYGLGGVGNARFSNDTQPRGIIGLGDETSVALRDSARNAMNVDDEAGRGAIGLATDVDFFRAILAVHRGDVDEAREHIASARDALGAELAALVTESYDRSYGGMIRVQQLTELEEVIEYTELGRVLDSSVAAGNARGGHSVVGGSIPGRGVDAGRVATRRETMRRMWRDRIYGVQRKVEVWQALLAVRSLVLPATEETGTWLKFASLNRKAGRTRQAQRTLLRLLGYDPASRAPGQPGYGAGSGRPEVMLAYVKHQWSLGNRRDAFARLQSLVGELGAMSAAANMGTGPRPDAKFVARSFLRLGQWRWAIADDMDDSTLTDVLTAFRTATDACHGWAKAWHNWALFNAAAMEHYQRVAPALANRHVAPAISGFFRSIALGGVGQQKRKGGPLQDILRLLTLWFNHGAAPEVEVALMEGFGHVSIDTWLAVIPQIVARIHSNSSPVRSLIHQLLVRVGRQHPQALLYPLLVACKSQSATRRSAAMVVLDNLRQHSPLLVEQAQVVSLELIRVAILWHEAWHEALEEASQLYFGEQNVDGMLRVLAPLHHIIERLGAETMHEVSFVQAYGRELSEAHDWCQKYKETGREEELNQAWDLYYHVFKRINKQLPTLTTLELQYVSPRLLAARELELCVPGNYMPGVPGGSVTIAAFAPTMHVITSKQRPRRLQIHGSDGKDYGYLLKGHEDLRQDERVMQLFGLVNMLLNSTPSTATRDLGIARYAVVPLSPNSGLIGWVPNCDTLHALIREHRDAHKVPLNLEHRLMLAMAPDYDHLPLVNKVEVFEHALENTPGNDLARVLWLKSRSSETWLDRRTTYTRSLAVMSMVGYLLGLGDRHPSNLMLDRYSGKILHIDFGDCFEASMHREKFPERVPFRLTRMLVRAMEVSGIEGNFRSTCEGVMSVLRSNKDSVMAMLEAFVHDPLINWRLLNQTAPGETANAQPGGAVMTASAVHVGEKPGGGGGSSGAPTPTQTPGPNGSGSGHSAAGGSGSESGLNGSGQHGSGQHDGTAGGPCQNARAPTPPPMPPLAEGEEGSNARSANAGSGESGVGGIVGDPGNGQPTNPANHQSPFATEYPPSVDASDAVDQRALEEAATAAAYQAAAEAKMRRSTGSATSGGPGQEDGGLTTPAPTIFAPGHLPPDEYAVVRDAAASEMRRDRVTALDAVEGLNVDANEVLNDRAVSVMRRMSHKLTGRDGSASSAAAGAPGGHLAGHSPGPGGRSQHEDVENSTPDGIEAQVQRLIVGATSHENLCQSYIGWCPFW